MAGGPHVAYRDETFDAANGFVRRLRRRGRPAEPRGRRSGARGAWSLALVLARLPHLTLTPSTSPGGRAIADYLRSRRYGVPVNRLAQTVLPIPPTVEDYLRGRRRQAVRTNIRRAREAGVTCRPLRIGDECALLGVPVELISHPGDAWWGAFDARGRTLALAIVSLDGEWAMLNALKSRSHLARYLLHTEIVSFLAASGVRRLLVNGGAGLVLDDGLRYFQRRLGYEVVHVRLGRAYAATERRDREVPPLAA